MHSAKPLSHDEGKVDMRVQDYWGRVATVRWVGKLDKKETGPGKETGHLVGIEYDEESENPLRFDGTLTGGKSIFKCDAKKGFLCKGKDLFPEMNTEGVRLLREHFGKRVESWHDFELVKFCIARKFEMEKVYEMLEKHLAWRADFQPSEDEFFPQTIVNDYPAGYMGEVDYDENLIYCERPSNGGACHPSEFVKKYTLPVIARWHACGMEMGIQRMRQSNYRYKRVCYVVDLLNVNAMTRPMIGFAQTLASVEQDNYPENLGRVFIVNCPAFFRFAWKLVKIFIDERTNKKINFVGPHKAVEAMTPVMNAKFIPNFCGGPANMWMETNGGMLGSTDPKKAHKGAPYCLPGTTQSEMEELEEEVENNVGAFEEIPDGDFPTPTASQGSPTANTMTGSPLNPSHGKEYQSSTASSTRNKGSPNES